MNIFEKRKAQEQVEKDMREARSESAKSKREGRDLKKAQSTGRVSSFLNSRSQSDEVLRATLGVIRASDPLSQAQATVQYQQKVGEVTNGIRQVSSGGIGGASKAGNELPPRPGDSEVYFLASENTELKWEVGGGGGNAVAHPFQVRLEANEQGVQQYIIELNSNLYKGLGNFDKQSITGLNSPSTPSTGFLSLFGVVDEGVVTSASIQGPEATPSDRIDIQGSGADREQNSFNYLIAYLYQDGDSWKVRQLCFQDLTLMNVCIDGVACVYPFAV